MAAGYETFIALRYLRSKRKEVFISIITVISVLGVAVSVMVLDIVMAVMTGFERELQTKLVDANAHVVVRRYGGLVVDYQPIIDKVLAIPGVATAYPFTYNQAMIRNSSEARGILIRGVAPMEVPKQKLSKMMVDPQAVEKLFSPSQIEVLRPDGSPDQVSLPPLIVGKALRNVLGVMPGSQVMLFAPQAIAAPQGLVPKYKRFVAVDFYSSTLYEYESGLAYVSIADAQQFFGLGRGVTGIEVGLNDFFLAPQISKKIADVLSAEEFPYEVSDWTEQNRPLWEAIQLEKRVYFIVLLLLILVASFSVVATLVMVVMEKGRDIAILKTMGASDGGVRRIFLIQGGIIGLTGVLLGSVLGFVGSYALREFGFKIDARVFSMDTVPVQILPSNMLTVAAAALVITCLAGIYPARRAAQLTPADALRYE